MIAVIRKGTLFMKKRMKEHYQGMFGVLLAILTMLFTGCVVLQVEEGAEVQKPVVTEAPETPIATQLPETALEPEMTAEPAVTAAPEVTPEPEQSEADSPENQAVEEIIRASYETCKDTYDGIYPETIKNMTICAATEEYISVNIAANETLSPTDYFHMELAFENGQWKVTEFTGLYSKNGPYAEELISLEPLACDSVEFPGDTVVPLAMGSTVGVDLDGDGMQELVQVSFGSVCGPMKNGEKPAWNTLYYELPVVRINDYIYDEEYLQENLGHYAESADIATWYIFDVDVNDGYKEIGLYEDGPSDDPYTTLFRYEGGVLREIGGFSDCPIRGSMGSWALKPKDDYQALVNSVERSELQIQVPGDGTILATQRIDILETSFVEGMWKLQNSGNFEEASLDLQLREEYIFKGYEYRMTDTEFCPMVREELQVYTDKDFTSQVTVLAQGEKVIPYRYYPDTEAGETNGWVELIYREDFAESGWIYVTNRMNIYQVEESGEVKESWSGDLMDNLSFAD